MRQWKLLAVFLLAFGFASAVPTPWGSRALAFGSAQPVAASFVLVTPAQADEPAASPSPALKEPANLGDVISEVSPLIEAVKAKNWAMLAAIVLMLLVYAVRMLLLPYIKMSPDWLAVVSAGLGCVVAVGAGLASGLSVWSALAGGLFLGAAASGFWELLFKRILPGHPSEAAKG